MRSKEIKSNSFQKDTGEDLRTGKTTLQNEQQLLYHFFTQAPGMFAILKGPDHLFEFANPRYMELIGNRNPIGKTVREAMPELEGQGLYEILDNVYNTGEAFTRKEMLAKLARGNAQPDNVYFNLSYQAIKNEEGFIEGILVFAYDVTEQVFTKKKIEESEQRLRLAVESGRLGTFEIDLVNKTIIFSERLAEIFGLDPSQKWTHQDLKDALHPDDVAIRNKAHEISLQTGALFYEARVIWKNESVHWIRTSGRVRYENKIPFRLYGTVLDITEEKEAEKKIKENEKRFITLANSIPQLAWMMDAEGWIYWYNQRWYDYTGTTLEEMQGWGWQTVHHPDLLEDVTERFKKAIATGEPYEQIFLLRSKEGEYRWFLTRAVPIRNEEGKILQWFGTNTDVTDQRNTENALKESEERFRTLAETLPQLVWMADAKGAYEYASGKWLEYSGLDPKKEESWELLVHTDDMQPMMKTWFKSLSTGQNYHTEARLKSKHGEYRWHIVQGEPIRNEKEEIIKWIGAFTDIHEQKMMEQKKDEFISIASHEMKTPLTTAKAYLQLLEMNLDEGNGQIKIFAKKANDSVERLNQLIAELLDVSKIQEGKINYNFAPFNFNELIDDTVEDMQHSSPKHIIIKTGKTDSLVTGDKDRLQQVVINLLSNAIKYSPGSKDVYINVAENAGEVKLSVKDQGIGMNKQHLQKIFDRYYRVEENATQFQGLGIGLYISNEIIHRHNGKLWAESEPGKGSTFYFTLPVSNT